LIIRTSTNNNLSDSEDCMMTAYIMRYAVYIFKKKTDIQHYNNISQYVLQYFRLNKCRLKRLRLNSKTLHLVLINGVNVQKSTVLLIL